MSREKQDDWKRTQVRIPCEQYITIAEYANSNNLSLNSAMLELMEKGIHVKETRILTFDNLTEESMTIDLNSAVIALVKSQYHEIVLQQYRKDVWMLSYHSLRCLINDDDAHLLLNKGCTLKK